MKMRSDTLLWLLILEHSRAKLRAGVRITETGCWEWMRSGDGRYGHIHILGTRFKTHVAAALLWNGIRLRTRVLRHQCDNSICCNPGHLLPGTQKQNRQEAADRGRAVGLTKRQATRAKGLITRGYIDAEVARRIGCHPSTILRIRTGATR